MALRSTLQRDRTETQFEDSERPIRLWFLAAFLMQYKASVKWISRTTHVSYLTAFKIVDMLRRSIYTSQVKKKLRGIV